MKKIDIALTVLVLLAALTGCTFPSRTQTLLPTLVMVPSPTFYLVTGTWVGPTPTVATPVIPASISPTSTDSILPTPIPTLNLPTVTPAVPTNTAAPTPTLMNTPTPPTGVVTGPASGPYGVILIASGDVLSIRSGAGTGYPVAGSFPATATNVLRTGPSSMAGNDLWVQVQNPGGGTGWVNSRFLTEYKASSDFCSDSRVNSLLSNFGTAVSTSNGELLSALVSPAHGMTVYLWRNGIPHTFKQSDARWVFDSTYAHNWGSAPASGLDTIGPFHVEVAPWLQEVFNASPTLTCNSLGNAAQYGYNPWPLEYTNVNFFTVLKPGTPGVDLDFRYWLVGVEYFQGQPFVFALIHFAWEP
jgi:uncharacterized protein YgiM (DUF1202 family)